MKPNHSPIIIEHNIQLADLHEIPQATVSIGNRYLSQKEPALMLKSKVEHILLNGGGPHHIA